MGRSSGGGGRAVAATRGSGRTATVRVGGGGGIIRGSFIKMRGTSFTGIVTGQTTLGNARHPIPAFTVRGPNGRTSAIPRSDAVLVVR